MICRGACALVTGAARRVGRAIALELARAGCDIAVHYGTRRTDAETLIEEIVAAGRRARAFQGDLADPRMPGQLVAAVLERFDRIDVLVNNAAIFQPDPEGGFDAEHWRRTMQINAIAPAALIDAAGDGLTARRGAIVNICDIAAERPWRHYQAYCSSKAALANLTRSAARQLAPHVRVNGVSPGIAVFPDDFDDQLRRKLINRVPLSRSGQPEDIAGAVRFLVEHGDYITGQILNVDGGRSVV